MRYTKLIYTVLTLLIVTACEKEPTGNQPYTLDYTRADSPSLNREEAKLRSDTLANIKYFIQVDLTKSERYTGTVEIKFDYKPSPFPLTIDFTGGEAERVLVNSTPIPIDYDGHFIKVPGKFLDTGFNTIKVQFSHGYATKGSGLNRFIDPIDRAVYIYSNFSSYSANKFVPLFDQPDLKAEYELRVAAPKNWTVITAKRESEVITDGPYNRWKFTDINNISSYAFPLHAGPWRIWEAEASEIPLRLLSRQSVADSVNPREWFKVTQQGFEYLENYFDIKFPYSKYDQLLVPELKVHSKEGVGASIFNENLLSQTDSTKTLNIQRIRNVLNELSKMWFGNLVTVHWWDNLWLKNGLASFLATKILDEGNDYKNVWKSFYTGHKRKAYPVYPVEELNTAKPVNFIVDEIEDDINAYNDAHISKSASILKQLQHYIGEQNFKNGIRLLLKSYQNKTVSYEDFITAINRANGKPIDNWADTWFQKAGLNTIKAEYQCIDGKVSSFKLMQMVPDTHPYQRSHLVQVALFYTNEQNFVSPEAITTVKLESQSKEINEFIGETCPQLVMPNYNDWTFASVDLDHKTALLLESHIQDIQDPLSRSMFWSGLWMKVKTKELSVDRFVELININISREKDPELQFQLVDYLNQIFHWIRVYSTTSTILMDKLDDIELLYLEESQIAQDNSLMQKFWFQEFIKASHTERSIEHLSGWLKGLAEPRAIATDVALRWQVINRLSAAEITDAKEIIDQEYGYEPTELAQLQVKAATLTQPDKGLKKQWLNEMSSIPTDHKDAQVESILPFLFPPEQTELKNALVNDVINFVKHNETQLLRSGKIIQYLNYLMPSFCSSESEVRWTQIIKEFSNSDETIIKVLSQLKHQDQLCYLINTPL